jgi:DNA repair exonuclease SbcCD ATPase subunit
MSVTNDAVSGFRNRFLAVIHRGDQKFPQSTVQADTKLLPVSNVLEQGLLAVARDSADIRRDHDAILLKAASLNTLQEDLLAVFERSYQALEQLAEARSHLSKAETVAKFERDARESASQRLSGLTATYHQTVSELEKLRPENKQLQAALHQLNEKLTRLEDDNALLNTSLSETRTELERKQAQEVVARREHDTTKAELASANKFVAQKLLEMSQLHERAEIAEQASRASAKALDESRGECANALVRLDEERVHYANAQSRIAALETQLRDLGEKFSAARGVFSASAEKFNQTISELKEKLAQANGLDEAHQRLLTTAQSDLIALRRQNSELEDRLVDRDLVVSQLRTRAESAEQVRDQFGKDLEGSKRLHQSLLRRVKPMIAALREKNAESSRLSSTLGDIDQRFLTYQSESSDTIRSLQDRETFLVAALETERARRVVAEGALAIDRSFRPIETQKRLAQSDG